MDSSHTFQESLQRCFKFWSFSYMYKKKLLVFSGDDVGMLQVKSERWKMSLPVLWCPVMGVILPPGSSPAGAYFRTQDTHTPTRHASPRHLQSLLRLLATLNLTFSPNFIGKYDIVHKLVTALTSLWGRSCSSSQITTTTSDLFQADVCII